MTNIRFLTFLLVVLMNVAVKGMQSWDSPFGASSGKFQDRNQATGGWAKIKDLWQAMVTS
jgi:hypothetical protein